MKCGKNEDSPGFFPYPGDLLGKFPQQLWETIGEFGGLEHGARTQSSQDTSILQAKEGPPFPAPLQDLQKVLVSLSF